MRRVGASTSPTCCPTPIGHLSPFCIEQLVGRGPQPAALPRPRGHPRRVEPLARPLARHVRRTSSRWKTVLAQLHGQRPRPAQAGGRPAVGAACIGSKTLQQQQQQGSPAPSNAPQGLAAEPAEDDDGDDALVRGITEESILAQMHSQPGAAAAAAAVAGTNNGGGGGVPLAPRSQPGDATPPPPPSPPPQQPPPPAAGQPKL